MHRTTYTKARRTRGARLRIETTTYRLLAFWTPSLERFFLSTLACCAVGGAYNIYTQALGNYLSLCSTTYTVPDRILSFPLKTVPKLESGVNEIMQDDMITVQGDTVFFCRQNIAKLRHQ